MSSNPSIHSRCESRYRGDPTVVAEAARARAASAPLAPSSGSKLACTAALALVLSVLHADTAAAQQTLNFSVGAFTVRGEDARVDGDVLVANRDVFLFDFSDFTILSLGAEWLVPIGDYLEAGAGIGFASRGVPTIYAIT